MPYNCKRPLNTILQYAVIIGDLLLCRKESNFVYLNDETVNNNIEYLSNTINIGKPIVNILWTGGWDSTFRILDLAEKGIIIQPYYISDNRKSESFELNAIGEISARLNELQSTKSLIMPLKILKSSEIPEDREITDSYNILRDQVFMGSQYDWLARFESSPYLCVISSATFL